MNKKIKLFIENFYCNYDNTLKELIKFLDYNPTTKYKVKYSSSNKSVIIIDDESVYKFMKPVSIDKTLNTKSNINDLIKYNKESIPLLLKCKDNFTICIRKILISPDINIIKYEKLKPIKTKNKLKKLLIMMFEVSIALKNIHKKGFYHNDVYLSNIGCRYTNNCCEYILYDFELANYFTPGQESEQMLSDVLMFLEDLKLQYIDEPKFKLFFDKLINKLNINFIKDTGKTKKIYKRICKIYENTYNFNDFYKIILKIIKEYKSEGIDNVLECI